MELRIPVIVVVYILLDYHMNYWQWLIIYTLSLYIAATADYIE